ncbi:MAG: aryl-sulfate sulfotransferase [Bacteroidetes bacterium]|nr:aryl-sulfate sulfotransferase [Bacteroidota bacterium]MDA0902865.1 aryl-sulfate sulfotransferase [Bacteroidota bacterium]MDA1241982.1 aryl-sulfate sulfotransferase [Bacteroidota bacterium]
MVLELDWIRRVKGWLGMSFMMIGCQVASAQSALDDVGVEILVPPGGLNADGSSAGLPVDPGDLLLSLIETPTSMFASVMNADAEFVWAEQTPFHGFYMKPWHPGEYVLYDFIMRKWLVVDLDLNPVDTLTQSFQANDDYHDVMLLDDGTYMVVLLEHLPMNLLDIGGLENSEVLNPRLLHLDSNENILHEWSGIEALPLDPEIDILLFPTVDHLHWNSMQFDAHGGLLLSMRNRSQIVRLRPEDWTIHWKLGGAENQFVIDDPDWEGFNVQHDVHDLGDGRILMFDNALYNNGTLSRALELELDTVNFTAQRVWQFAHPDGVYSAAQGSAIRMDNGNTLIGWGTAGAPTFGSRVTEVTQDGQIVLDIRFENGAGLYRARKYPLDLIAGCRDTLAVNVSDSPWLLAPSTCFYDIDEDGDGITDWAGDCDDGNASIYPGAPEVPDDGIDQDCDGVDLMAGCMDVLAQNFNFMATFPDGSCSYNVVARVDLATEAQFMTELDPWDAIMSLTHLSDTAFEEAIHLTPTNVAWHVAQFGAVIQEGAYVYRFQIPGDVEDEVRDLEVIVGQGDLDLGVVCFDEWMPCPGCLDPMDVAYNPMATEDAFDTLCEGWVVEGCTYSSATNYQALANLDDGTCVFDMASDCPGDFDQDGTVTVTDLLEMLVVIGTACD